MPTPEHTRLAASKNGTPWKKFGPYLSERQWGTVREDYSEFGAAWEFFTHDDARSRTYRWGEDGIAGISDDQQLLCFALSFWNGKDPILKERLFGLTGNQGNHSEDVKELYYYIDNTPTHSYMKYRYKYPQNEFPYWKLVEENRNRNVHDPEFELSDTGIFDQNEYFDIYIEYAKVDSEDIVIKVTAYNRSDKTAPLHLLPTIWFRNTWAWGDEVEKPSIKIENENELAISHPLVGEYQLTGEGTFETLFTDNETNAQRLYGLSSKSEYVKDAFHEYVIQGNKQAVNPQKKGTKAALHYELNIPAHSEEVIYVRLTKKASMLPLKKPLSFFERGWGEAKEIVQLRLTEANQFYDHLQKGSTIDQKNIQRQAFAGMLWGKQFYNFNVKKWLNGDTGQYPPPEIRKAGRNHHWQHIDCHDIISMPDKWEYPWFAAWDSAFHCIPIAQIDPEFAKQQLLLFLDPRYMNAQGQIPAYEWAFGDVNPPVHAYGCWQVYEIDKVDAEKTDKIFLHTAYHQLKPNFEWWLKTQRVSGKYLFGGGFLGLDNVGLLDRGAPLPDGAWLEQMDGTCWMALYALNMMRMSLELADGDIQLQQEALYYAAIFFKIVYDMNHSDYGFWDEENSFYNDTIRFANGTRKRMNIKNIVDLMALYPVELIGKDLLAINTVFEKGVLKFQNQHPEYLRTTIDGTYIFRAVSDKQFDILTKRLYNKDEFLAPFGIRSLSKFYDKNPYNYELNGQSHTLCYKPAESDTTNFGENSNWRGPVWFPVNYVLIDALIKFHKASYQLSTLNAQLIERLTNLFLQKDNNHEGNILFYEYFNPETGKGCGASHQTGWTGLVATLIMKTKEL